MTDMNQIFAPIMETLTKEELELFNADIRKAEIVYIEALREIAMSVFDKAVAQLIEEPAVSCTSKRAVRASGHDSTDVSVQNLSLKECPSRNLDFEAPATGDDVLSCGNAKIEDIAMCKDQREAAHNIGRLNPGGFAVSEAALLIHAAGLSKGRLRTVAANLYTLVNRYDDWQKLEPGRIILLPDSGHVADDKYDQLCEEVEEESKRVQVAHRSQLSNANES